jgi:oxidase EvaA
MDRRLGPGRLGGLRQHDGARFARSAEATGSLISDEEVVAWLRRRKIVNQFAVDRIAFGELDKWSFAASTGDLVHDSGRFFAIQGLTVTSQFGPVHAWQQPIINQPENGLLGLLVREIDGVPHFLVQAKMEPGNPHTIELSPTVQATRSNFTRVHQGAKIRYFEHFAGPGRGRVITDVLQSEQGDSFYHKRNRNMVVEVTGDVEEHEDFRWLTLAQINRFLARDSTVNMDIRTVLSTLPMSTEDDDQSTLRTALSVNVPARYGFDELLSWLTGLKCHYEMTAERMPLREVADWKRTEYEISHVEGKFFSVVAVSVQAETREVVSWTQPMLTPARPGVAAFVMRHIDGVPHVLVQGKPQPGLFDFFEVAPTVHCVNADYRNLPRSVWPPYLEYVLEAPARYSVLHSEEGGRFLNRENRYMIVEAGDDFPDDEGKNYRWVTPYQLRKLASLSNCVNVEARTLLTCLASLW